jgi:enoyl-[acyl-carrier-protein] reductase (NADH)
MFERTISEIQLEEWDLMMSVNLRAPLFLAQAALPHMRARGGGSVINIGSIEGLGANPDHAAYCASKAGIHGMTRAMAVDLGADNIRCNAIAPGWISSELSEMYLESQPDPAGVRDALNRLHPLVSRVRSDFTVSGCDNAVCRLLLAWKSGVRTSRRCVAGCGPRGFGPGWRSGPGSCCWPVKGCRTPRSPPGSG